MSLLTLIFILYTSFRACEAEEAPVYDTRATVFSEALSKTINGSPQMSIDPLYISYLAGSFATLQYQNYNNTVTGLSNCEASDIILSQDGRVINFVLDCPSYVLYSSNEVRGYLLYRPIRGRGTLEINYGRYVVRVYALLSYVSDSRRNVYYKVGRFTLDIELKGTIKYNFMHLYNDDLYKNEEINQFANDNNEITAIFSKDPVWYPIMTRVIANLNICLLSAPSSII